MILTKEQIETERQYQQRIMARSVENSDIYREAKTRASIAELALSAIEWLPIQLAPEDGTKILAAIEFSGGFQIQTVFFGNYHPNSRGKEVWREAWSNRPVPNFEWWRPLPNFPVKLPTVNSVPLDDLCLTCLGFKCAYEYGCFGRMPDHSKPCPDCNGTGRKQ